MEIFLSFHGPTDIGYEIQWVVKYRMHLSESLTCFVMPASFSHGAPCFHNHGSGDRIMVLLSLYICAGNVTS